MAGGVGGGTITGAPTIVLPPLTVEQAESAAVAAPAAAKFRKPRRLTGRDESMNVGMAAI